MLFRKLHSADTPFKTNRFYSGSVSKHSFYFVHFYFHLCHKKKDRSTVSTSKHVRSTITCQAAPFDMWPLKAKQVSLRNGNKRERERQKHPTQWKCGYFRELPGVPVCPRNDWGLKNVVAVYAERGFAASGRGIFGKHFGPLSLDGSSRLRQPDLENCNPDSQSQTLETERRRVTTDLNCGEVLSVRQTHLG